MNERMRRKVELDMTGSLPKFSNHPQVGIYYRYSGCYLYPHSYCGVLSVEVTFFLALYSFIYIFYVVNNIFLSFSFSGKGNRLRAKQEVWQSIQNTASKNIKIPKDSYWTYFYSSYVLILPYKIFNYSCRKYNTAASEQPLKLPYLYRPRHQTGRWTRHPGGYKTAG